MLTRSPSLGTRVAIAVLPWFCAAPAVAHFVPGDAGGVQETRGARPAVPAQEPASSTRLSPVQEAAKGAQAREERSVEEWIERLGDPSFRIREEAEAALRALGTKVRSDLDRAADSQDPEVRWRIAKLRSELSPAEPGLQPGALRPVAPERGPESTDRPDLRSLEFGTLRSMMEEMRQRLAQDGAGSTPGLRGFYRGRPFELRFFDDPFGVLGESAGEPSRPSVPAPGTHFLKREWNDGRVRSIDVHVDTEGKVRVEVVEDGDRRTTEAESWERFQESEPELARALGPSLPQPARAEGPVLPVPDRLTPGDGLRLQPVEAPRRDGPVLGVRVEDVHPALADYLELEPDEGLMIVEVVSGSLAESLGIEPKDILLALGQRPLRGVEDVRAELERSQGALTRAVVLRRGVERELTR